MNGGTDLRVRIPVATSHGVVLRRERQTAGRRVAALLACVTLALAMIVVAVTKYAPEQAALGTYMVSDTLNGKFLQASANADFLSRLNEMWFVESNAGKPEIAAAATELATTMQIAGFPKDMLANIDTTVNPCEDFYEFSCGKYDDEHRDQIPGYKSSLAYAWDQAEKTIKGHEIEILKADEGPAGTLFKSCMDVDAIEKLGGEPLQPWLKYIDAIHDKASLVSACATLSKHGEQCAHKHTYIHAPRRCCCDCNIVDTPWRAAATPSTSCCCFVAAQ